MEIGAQFYTLRDFCQTPEALAESLAKVADIGYKTVQISGTCAFDPAWIKQELDKNGLRCVLTHTASDRMINAPVAVAADHDVFGCDYIGLGWHTLGEGDDGKTTLITAKDDYYMNVVDKTTLEAGATSTIQINFESTSSVTISTEKNGSKYYVLYITAIEFIVDGTVDNGVAK